MYKTVFNRKFLQNTTFIRGGCTSAYWFGVVPLGVDALSDGFGWCSFALYFPFNRDCIPNCNSTAVDQGYILARWSVVSEDTDVGNWNYNNITFLRRQINLEMVYFGTELMPLNSCYFSSICPNLII